MLPFQGTPGDKALILISRAMLGFGPRQVRVCAACGADGGRVCTRCRAVAYCGPRCQRRDWKEGHREVCTLVLRRRARLDLDAGCAGSGGDHSTTTEGERSHGPPSLTTNTAADNIAVFEAFSEANRWANSSTVIWGVSGAG